MLEKLINIIISKNNKNPNKRSWLIKFASIVGIIINLLLAIIKVLIGLSANSISILSDAVNNFTDSLSSIVTLFGLKISQRPPDKKHPLGYGRFEYISGLIIALIVTVVGIEFFKTSISRITSPEVVNFSIIQFIILALSILGKIFLSRLNIVVGKETNSSALQASGAEAMTDVLASLLTIIAAIISKYTGWMIDGYVGVLLSLFILYTGIGLVRETINNIIGTRPEKDLVQNIQNDLLKNKAILGAYDFIIHNYGPTVMIGSVNLEIADTATVKEAYEIMINMQQYLLQKYQIYFTFGLYSVNTTDEKTTIVRKKVEDIVMDVKHILGIHAFNFDELNKVIRFDIIVDFDITDFPKIQEELQNLIHLEFPNYLIYINIDLDYA